MMNSPDLNVKVAEAKRFSCSLNSKNLSHGLSLDPEISRLSCLPGGMELFVTHEIMGLIQLNLGPHKNVMIRNPGDDVLGILQAFCYDFTSP